MTPTAQSAGRAFMTFPCRLLSCQGNMLSTSCDSYKITLPGPDCSSPAQSCIFDGVLQLRPSIFRSVVRHYGIRSGHSVSTLFNFLVLNRMMPRVFVSIPINNASDLEPVFRDLSRIRSVKSSPAYQLHITLSFIGDIPDEKVQDVSDAVECAVRGEKHGRITLKGCGCFPTAKRPRIFYAGLESELPLESIAERIRAGLDATGIPYDGKPFKPHITIGRVQGNTDLTMLVNKYRTTEFTTFICRDVMVMKSELRPEGAVHTILHVCPLQ